MSSINPTIHTIALSLSIPNKSISQGLYEAGIPVPLGMATKIDQFRVECDGAPIDCAAKIINHWHDKSISWIYLSFFVPETTHSSYTLVLDQNRKFNSVPNSDLSMVETEASIEIQNDKYTCILDTHSLSLELVSAIENISSNTSHIKYADISNQSDVKLSCIVDSINKELYTNLADGSQSAIKLNIKGKYLESNASHFANFDANFTFFKQHSFIHLELTVHNPNAAQHPDGSWDLGDPGSIFFNSLDFTLQTQQANQISYQTELAHQWTTFTGKETAIEQLSSGGKNWRSPVHLDKTNTVSHTVNGYREMVSGEPSQTGQRAIPTVVVQNNVSFTVEQFWQNFPKGVYLSSDSVKLSLFPKLENTSHELQAGERKTHKIWIGANGHKNELEWIHQTRQISIPLSWTQASHSIATFSKPESNTLITSLIANGLSDKSNFFAKREMLDEFGWRNFGDIYADHETASYAGDGIFVSHYNNQYDPIYGFLKQYLLTGNSSWFELADDLAKHVKDIDIYHTNLDKKEYNGGLFWHTDHYLEAFTSSHRSYSKHQSSDAYQDHAGGGGPGGQHCYTTGLKLHYCMTGSESSKQAVLTLSQWITNVYEGSDTCLELLLAFKNRNVEGLKNHFTGQYPLDRGTANYVIALLDSYELTQEDRYLRQVETILMNSMHPDEDLTHRNLHDIENTWFYTVLLQAVCRYLEVKENKQELDNNFYYCRDCLLNFADWMLIHEYPYLDKPDILEYPNDTWTAQDLRKAHVFSGAYYYSSDRNPKYLAKAQFFEQYVANKLNSSDTKTYTRILVLLMQNCGAVDFYSARNQTINFAQRSTVWSAADYQSTSLTSGLLKVLFKRLIKLSLKNELDWLKKRLA